MILVRYLTKEVLLGFTGITSVLVCIALSHRFIAYLGKSAKGELPVDFVFKAMSFYLPELLAYLMPLGFFMALLFAYGRLYADSEMIVFSSHGLSLRRITGITLCLSCLIALIVGLLTIGLIPKLTRAREQILVQGHAEGMLHLMTPGRFHFLESGGLVFYVGDKTQDKLKEIFIAQKQTTDTIITARSAKLVELEHNQSYLVLEEGFRYQGVPSQLDYTQVQFQEYGREIIRPQAPLHEKADFASSRVLFKSQDPEYIAELHWRIATPLSVLILTLIAIPLASVDPRQGRFARFLPAVMVYILYYNLMLLAKRWLGTAVIPIGFGLWWVHLLFLGLGISLFRMKKS